MKDVIIDNTFGQDVSPKGMLRKWEGKIDGKNMKFAILMISQLMGNLYLCDI